MATQNRFNFSVTLIFYKALSLFLIALPITLQAGEGPKARFTFNGSSVVDEITGNKAKLIGVRFIEDRFNNKNNAVFLNGNNSSYINLGNYEALKPKTGSISMWVNMDCEIWAGEGRIMNPFIITKQSNGDDFYETYTLCYFPENKKACALFTRDSTKQLVISSINNFELNKWHHLAITYDYKHFSFYIDGKLENTFDKNFETKFLSTDSVLVGITANKKNNRATSASFDDIEFYDRVLSDDEVLGLYNAPNPNRTRLIVNRLFLSLLIVVIGILFYFAIKHQVSRRLRKEKEKLELSNKLLETELRVNKALMNPHFIFNALNSIQNFILNHENEQANDFLVKFSKLIRKNLESNMSDTITLADEIDLLLKYLEIENLRFDEVVSYKVNIGEHIPTSALHIPIMMLQPFVENAFWHGLKNKTGDKQITISFRLSNYTYLLCTIDDNGIGRPTDEKINLEKKSHATVFIRTRLNLLNKIHNLNCYVNIVDKPQGQGTIVEILLPILNRRNNDIARHNS